MPGAHVEAEGVDDARHERKLFSRANGAADANGVVGRTLAPGINVFERLGEVEIFERVVENNLEAGSRKFRELLRSERGGGADEGVIKRGVVPPVGGDGGEFAGHRATAFSHG